jgi:hypothetical protein
VRGFVCSWLYTSVVCPARCRASEPATDGELIAFWLTDGTVVAGMNVNVWDVTGRVSGTAHGDAQ